MRQSSKAVKVQPFVRKATKIFIVSWRPSWDFGVFQVLSLIFKGTAAVIVLFEPSFVLVPNKVF